MILRMVACAGLMAVSAVSSSWAQPAAPAATAPAAQFGPIPTPAQPGAIPLIAKPPKAKVAESWTARGPAGRLAMNVSAPTLTPFLPDPAKATGAAVVVAPGGGFVMLSMDAEGYDVARWLADHGVAAFVLKYRTHEMPSDPKAFQAAMGARMKSVVDAKGSTTLQTPPEAIEDATAAMRMVRARAGEWKIDPKRVGFVGFSAGAMTALGVGLTDDKAARPDFIAPIYPPMSARAVPADAPPMFVAIALDDPLFAKGKDIGLIQAWRDAGRPVEAHLYERGGHGFGMGARTASARLWIDEFYAWITDRGFLKPSS